MAPVVEIKGLSYSYRGQPALESVDLTVEQGDFMAVLGPNGGGKSTLLKILAGLLRPRMGRVRVFGQSPAKARGRVGYTPQENGFEPRLSDHREPSRSDRSPGAGASAATIRPTAGPRPKPWTRSG